MARFTKQFITGILGLTILSIVGGCAPVMSLTYAHRDFESLEIEKITILPILDERRRINPEDKDFPEVLDTVEMQIVERLKKLGYTVSSSHDYGSLGTPSKEQIVFSDSEFIAQIGPSDARWLLVPIMDDYFSSPNYYATRREMTVFLFDKEQRRLVLESSAMSPDMKTVVKKIIGAFPKR